MLQAMVKPCQDKARQSGTSVFLSSDVGQCLLNLDDSTRQKMRKKFDICYVMAKQSIPFAKYPVLIELESRHGVNLGPAYRAPDSAKGL